MAPLYRTAPVSPIPQADYLNSVVLAQLPAGAADPDQILDQVKTLEQLAGRRDGERFGPRPLDIDLLLVGDLVRSDGPATTDDRSRRGGRPGRELTLPHPRMRRRRFVLAPLGDLAPELRLPPDGALVCDLLAALGEEQRAEQIGWSSEPLAAMMEH